MLQERARAEHYLTSVKSREVSALSELRVAIVPTEDGYTMPSHLSAEMNMKSETYRRSLINSLYAAKSVPAYVAGIDARLKRELIPADGDSPLLHIKSDARPYPATGKILDVQEEGSGTRVVHNGGIMLNPFKVALEAYEFEGPCIRVDLGALVIASLEHAAIFLVEPVGRNGVIEHQTEIEISHPQDYRFAFRKV